MKTFIKSTAILTIISLVFSYNTVANITFSEEAYIDDIPFDTEAIYSSVVTERHIIDFNFEEDAFINDIPFATNEIAEEKLFELALAEEFVFSEEAYINDIPFDTKAVCYELYFNNISDSLTWNDDVDMRNTPQEEEVEFKYFEQHSHILMRY